MAETPQPNLDSEEPIIESLKADILSPEEYLKRTAFKEKEISEEIIEESLKRLSVSLKEIKYQESDTVEIATNEVKFKFSYSPVKEEESKTEINRYVNKKYTGLEGEPFEPFIANLSNWRKLDSLTFYIRGEEKDVFSSLPKNSVIVFCPTTEHFHGVANSTHNLLTKESKYQISIIGDMSCPRSIITLLHEMGHVFDEENKKKGYSSAIKEGYHYVTAEKIRRERTASAFAFKVMKPFLKNDQFKQDAINYLKAYALSSYNWEARENFEKLEERIPSLEKISRQEMGYWEAEQKELEVQSLIDDFWEWKKTDAYKQWKGKEENKMLDEFEEFGPWQQWVEDTNYDYSKDLKK